MRGKLLQLGHQSRDHDPYASTRPEQSNARRQVKVVGPEVVVGVHTQDCIEGLVTEPQIVRIQLKWQHESFNSGLTDAALVFGGAHPQISSDDRDLELLG